MNFKYLKYLAKRGEGFIHPGGYAATISLIEQLDPLPGEKILEYGCGTGSTLCEIASTYNIDLYGVDILDEMVGSAKQRIDILGHNEKIKLEKIKPGSNLPFRDHFFDKIFMESVIGFQDADTIKFMLKEIRRLLKAGGMYIICEAFWKEGIPDETVSNLCRSSEKDFGLSHASPTNITAAKFAELCATCGLQYIKRTPVDSIKGGSRINNYITDKKNILLPLNLYNHYKYKYYLWKHKNESSLVESYIMLFTKV